jgi:hypothetical protein
MYYQSFLQQTFSRGVFKPVVWWCDTSKQESNGTNWNENIVLSVDNVTVLPRSYLGWKSFAGKELDRLVCNVTNWRLKCIYGAVTVLLVTRTHLPQSFHPHSTLGTKLTPNTVQTTSSPRLAFHSYPTQISQLLSKKPSPSTMSRSGNSRSPPLDTTIHQLDIKSLFDALEPRQKFYAHYLARAAMARHPRRHAPGLSRKPPHLRLQHA